MIWMFVLAGVAILVILYQGNLLGGKAHRKKREEERQFFGEMRKTEEDTDAFIAQQHEESKTRKFDSLVVSVETFKTDTDEDVEVERRPASAHPLPDLHYATYCTMVNIKACKTKAKKAYNTYVALDFETTGLSAYSCSIIEVGAVKYSGGQMVGTFSTLVNPQKRIRKQITALTGITKEDLEKAPMLDDVLPQLIEFIGDSYLAAHNARFDADFLAVACNARNICKHFEFFDTLAISRRLFPELENHKLVTVAEHVESLYRNAHRAEDDAKVVGDIMELFFEHLDIM